MVVVSMGITPAIQACRDAVTRMRAMPATISRGTACDVCMGGLVKYRVVIPWRRIKRVDSHYYCENCFSYERHVWIDIALVIECIGQEKPPARYIRRAITEEADMNDTS